MNRETQRLASLNTERIWVFPVVFAFGVSAITGIVTHAIPGSAIWQQWAYLLHGVAGSILAVSILAYLFVHFRRTSGSRRPGVAIVGFASATVLLGLAATGMHTLLFGQAESNRWIYDTHVVLAYVGVILFGLHLAVFRFSRFLGDREKMVRSFSTLDASRAKRIALGILITVLAIPAATLLYVSLPQEPLLSDMPAVEPYELSYGEHPFRPSQTETPGAQFVAAKAVAGSGECGSCHADIFVSWKASIHSQAASDKAYTTNIDLLERNRGISAARYCEGCHAPVALLSGQLTPSGMHGGVPGTLANREGVSCMSCHGISRAVHSKGVASYEFVPADAYLFSHSDHPVGRRIRNFLIRIHPQEHRAEMVRPILKNPQLCGTCHEQFMDKDMNNWGWVKMQNEYSAWTGSYYSGQSDHTFSSSEAMRCQDCHMPLIDADDPSADASGKVRSHFILGANTAIPWFTGDDQQLRRVTEFLQTGKVRIDIDAPWRSDASRTDRYVVEDARPPSESPFYAYLGETIDLSVSVTNTLVGHNFPGGTTDINEVWIAFRVTDAEGRLVFESGVVEENGEVDPAAHFYRSIAVDRHGKEVWRHDLFNMVGNTYKKFIPPGGTDIVHYRFDVPFWAESPLTATAVVRYRKLNKRYAQWALGDEASNLPIVDMARASIVLPVFNKPEVAEVQGASVQAK